MSISFAIIGFLLELFLVFWPVVKILRRIGRSGWSSLLIFALPIGLWLLAYTRWRAIDPPKGSLS